MKKELTFYRGCDAIFSQISDTKAEVLAEGKKIQIRKRFDVSNSFEARTINIYFSERFLRWLEVLGTSLLNRKPNFQGPALLIHIVGLEWQDYVGDIEGFRITNIGEKSQPGPASKLEPSVV